MQFAMLIGGSLNSCCVVKQPILEAANFGSKNDYLHKVMLKLDWTYNSWQHNSCCYTSVASILSFANFPPNNTRINFILLSFSLKIADMLIARKRDIESANSLRWWKLSFSKVFYFFCKESLAEAFKMLRKQVQKMLTNFIMWLIPREIK